MPSGRPGAPIRGWTYAPRVSGSPEPGTLLQRQRRVEPLEIDPGPPERLPSNQEQERDRPDGQQVHPGGAVVPGGHGGAQILRDLSRQEYSEENGAGSTEDDLGPS